MPWEVLSQIDKVPDVAAGWVASSLFSSLLAWFCFRYLPAKDQQVVDMIDRHDARSEKQAEEFQAALVTIADRVAELDRERRNDVREALDKITAQHDREAASLIKSIVDLTTIVVELRHALEDDRRQRQEQ